MKDFQGAWKDIEKQAKKDLLEIWIVFQLIWADFWYNLHNKIGLNLSNYQVIICMLG